MKAVLEFNLPEDQEAWEAATRGQQYFFCLTDLADAFRSKVKYGDGQPVPWEEVRDLFWAALHARDVNLY